MSIKIAAAYIRVSTDDQLEYSPDSQLKVIRDYAQREGYIIPDDYVYREDDGISGKAAAKRPAFRMMIATAKQDNPPFDCIFVWKYSRFARNQEESIMYKNLLKKKGITVRSISEPSSDSPFSSLIERIIEWMDEYYLINLAEEVRRGMTEKASRGEAMGMAPFGYSVENKQYVPNKDADIVRHIFSAYSSGASRREIVKELTALGIKTQRGGDPSEYWIRYMLSNPAYIGKIRWSTEGHARYSTSVYNGDNVITVDGKHEPIIDMDTWNSVQTRLAERASETKYVRDNGHPVYMLKGLMKCDCCGATLAPQWFRAPALQCYRYINGACKTSHYISFRKAEQSVITYLEDFLERGEFNMSPKTPRKGEIVREWDKLISSEENKLIRAREAFLNGVFESDEYVKVRDELEANIEKLRQGKQAEAAERENKFDLAAYSKKVSAVLEILKSPDVSGQVKNEALMTIVEKIVFTKPSNELVFYFIP